MIVESAMIVAVQEAEHMKVNIDLCVVGHDL